MNITKKSNIMEDTLRIHTDMVDYGTFVAMSIFVFHAPSNLRGDYKKLQYKIKFSLHVDLGTFQNEPSEEEIERFKKEVFKMYNIEREKYKDSKYNVALKFYKAK